MWDPATAASAAADWESLHANGHEDSQEEVVAAAARSQAESAGAALACEVGPQTYTDFRGPCGNADFGLGLPDTSVARSISPSGSSSVTISTSRSPAAHFSSVTLLSLFTGTASQHRSKLGSSTSMTFRSDL